jgi:hypothetical protein
MPMEFNLIKSFVRDWHAACHIINSSSFLPSLMVEIKIAPGSSASRGFTVLYF